MKNRNGNYAAFYVAEPFCSTALRAYATPDFVYYNQLRMWKGADSAFPFVDSHDKTYSVRDGSDWESTLKPRSRAPESIEKYGVLLEQINTGVESFGRGDCIMVLTTKDCL